MCDKLSRFSNIISKNEEIESGFNFFVLTKFSEQNFRLKKRGKLFAQNEIKKAGRKHRMLSGRTVQH